MVPNTLASVPAVSNTRAAQILCGFTANSTTNGDLYLAVPARKILGTSNKPVAGNIPQRTCAPNALPAEILNGLLFDSADCLRDARRILAKRGHK